MKKLTIIFNKFTDTVTNEKKERAWKQITDSINSVSKTLRTVDEVRRKWSDWSSITKGKDSQQKREARKTGGGKAEDVQISEVERRLLCVACFAVLHRQQPFFTFYRYTCIVTRLWTMTV